ncbi:hypothetical protein [Paenibacillus sp. MBLB4367]|uniref:hypothetical protein n=1 Tax=Paenibacillus sp. MBLB4367 TaxID=3384767 RepID=UPI00390816AE
MRLQGILISARFPCMVRVEAIIILLVPVEREIFEALEGETLGWACIGPLLLQVRGKDDRTKAEMYQALGEGQRGLFLFRAYHNHACRSAVEWYWWTCEQLRKPKAWEALLAGLRFYGADETLRVMNKAETALDRTNRLSNGSWMEASALDLDRDPELRSLSEHLFAEYTSAAESAHRLIAAYIKSHPNQFVLLS